MAWTRRILGSSLALAVACQLSVGDGPIDPREGQAGSAGSAGAGGGAGSAGSSAVAGSAGNAGNAGSAGNGGANEVDAGAVDAGLLPIPPTCSVEGSDATDECVLCLKRECCSAWQGCNDRNCQTEREDLAQCVSLLEVQDSDGYGECVSTSSTSMDGFLQPNTETLMDCVNQLVPPGDGGIETTRCGNVCFGGDIFFDQ